MNRRCIRLAGILLGLTVIVQAMVTDGWAIWPFSSTTSTQQKAAKPAPAKKSPSALDSLANSTKKVFTNPFSKPAPKAASPSAINPWVAPPKKEEKKSWYDGLLAPKPKEPEKPKTVTDWMSGKRIDP